MTGQTPQYIPLTTKNRRLTGSSQVFISAAEDHILLVRTAWFVQHYSRFRLRDIRALVVHGRESSLPARVGVLVFAVLGAAALFRGSGTVGRGFAVVFAAAVILALIVDLVRGARGGVVIVTAATRTALPSITRLSRAHDFAGILGPVIRAVQADLPVQPPTGERPPVEQAVPELPRPRKSIVLPVVYYAAILSIGLISQASLLVKVPDNIASLSWTLSISAVALGCYVMTVGVRSLGARITAGATGLFCAADLVISAWSAFTVISGRSGPLPTNAPRHLQAIPQWFIDYSRISAPILIVAGIAGLALTLYTANEEGSE